MIASVVMALALMWFLFVLLLLVWPSLRAVGWLDLGFLATLVLVAVALRWMQLNGGLL